MVGWCLINAVTGNVDSHLGRCSVKQSSWRSDVISDQFGDWVKAHGCHPHVWSPILCRALCHNPACVFACPLVATRRDRFSC
jgi:Fe-S-cluster-containing dehydrogenase component